MRFFAFFAVGIIGCSGGSADAVSGPSPSPSSSSSTVGPVTNAAQCETVTADACKSAFHVATAAEVLGATKAFDYQRISISTSAKLTVGDDLIADADIEVLASDLSPVGSDCTTDCHAPLFRVQGFPSYAEVPGVTCKTKSTDQPVRQAFACAEIHIAKGTTFRLRAVIEDMHPSAPNYWAYADFTAPCTTSCAAGQVLCAESHSCFTPEQACLFCEGREPAYCACRTETCGQQTNGETCSYSSSPDVLVSGVCRGAGCQAFKK